MSLKVYVSGLHSDPNPSSGVGVARSLRLAYPGIKIIGIDYSPRSSGSHSDLFDEVIIMDSWNNIDLEVYKLQVERLLTDARSYWIPTLDLEVWWMASARVNSERVLIPPISALEQTRKPKIEAAKHLPLLVPPYIDASRPDEDLYEFFINHGCDVWVKGPYYEARRVRTWSRLKSEIRALSEAWGGGIYIQAHIRGREELLAYTAYKGELLDAVHVVKLITTREGKTWSGRVYEPSEELLEPLRHVIKQLNWTGGGELEFIRTSKDELYLIEWNPRFPAWIHGATIAGHNMPATLVEVASGVPYERTPQVSRDFIRVVYEIPSKFYINEPLISSFTIGDVEVSKHPSGMPTLSRRLKKTIPWILRLSDVESRPSLISEDVLEELRRSLNTGGETPRYILLENVIEKRFEKLTSVLHEVAREFPWIKIKAAYSIKTNPDERILRIARSKGFMAEAISQLEVEKALKYGYRCREIILNGPGKFWPKLRICGEFHAIFVDSLSELNRVLGDRKGIAEVVGVRVRHPLFEQRFGVDISSFSELVKIIELVKSVDTRFGVHFHIPSIVVGVERWFKIYKSIVKYARLLESITGKRVNVLDIGGGWSPKSFDTKFLPRLNELISYAYDNLGGLEEFLMEPGRALVEPGGCLITRVIDVRNYSQHKDVVVDASIAEMPLALMKPHAILYFNEETSEFHVIGRGRDRILGRLCMEEDILAVDVSISNVKEGDVLVFLNVGAYDMSMSYRFGRG